MGISSRSGSLSNHIMLLAVLISATAALPSYAGEVHQFNIPEEGAPAAIVAFGLQANVQIMVAGENVAGKTLHAVAGQLTTEQGLNNLLDGSGLNHEYVGDRAIAFVPVGSVVETQRPSQSNEAQRPSSDRIRMAQANRATDAEPADTDQSDSALGEVTVTATRRALNVVDVPMAMTVVGAAALQAQEVKTFNDFAAVVPNLSFNYGAGSAFGGNTDDRGVSIRGIQGSDTTGFYIDDLPIPASMNPRVLDLERIEVLKGPQGTLYGARSMGGTVRMITAAPDLVNTSAFFLSQGTAIDGGGNGYEFYGTFNVPLINNTLALHFTPYTGRDGGYINREWPTTAGSSALSRQKNSAATDYSGFTASMLWKPLEGLSVRPTVIYQSSSTNGLPLGDYSADNLTNLRHFDVPEGVSEQFWVGGVTVDYALPWGTFTSATDYLKRNTGDWEDISEFTSFVLGTPLVASPVAQGTSSRTWNQEIRFTSAWDSPFQLTAGLFYNRQSTTLDYRQNIPEFEALFGTTTIAANHAETVTDERAIFSELTYNLNSQWSATFGGRYSKDRQDFLLYAWGVAFGPNSQADAIPNITAGSGHTAERDSAFTPKFLLKYQPNANLDIFADAAKGFRPGSGQVAPPVTLCESQYEAYGLNPNDLSSYKPDSVWSYELGAKARSADHRYAINPSIFWIQWNDIRESLPFSCGFASLINSASARSRGAELDFSAVPIDHLTLTGGIGYTDAKILSPGTLVPYPAPGSEVQQVAPLTANFSVQYDMALAADWRLLMRGDYSYTDRSYSNTTSPQVPIERPAYSLVNLRAALDFKSMEYALFVKNAGDSHPNLGQQYSIGGFVPDRLRWTTGVPRTYGIEFSWRY